MWAKIAAVAVAAATLIIGAQARAQATLDGDCVVSIGWVLFEPYLYKDERGGYAGADLEILESAMGELGCAVEWRDKPWARILLEVERGALDMAPFSIRTVEREQFAHFSKPYMCETTRVWVRADNPAPKALSHLEELSRVDFALGVIRDAVYSPDYGELLKIPAFVRRLHVVRDNEKLLELLEAGRIDGMILRDLHMHRHMAENGLVGRFSPSRIDFRPLSVSHFMFSLTSVETEFVSEFNGALANLMSDGRFDRIVGAYHPDPETLRPRYDRADVCRAFG